MQEKEFYRDLGDKYRQLRESKGIKQIDAAKKAGISSGDLSKFEKSGKKLSAYRIKLLLSAIDSSIAELFEADEKKKSLRLSFAVS
jgi:transcriptional regulator with XRE-family HTH domain